jgi:hypothetical protein
VVLEWRPASVRDIDDLPHQVMADYWAIRAGQGESREAFAWYRVSGGQGLERQSHLFRPTFDGPDALARCGVERTAGATYERSDDGLLCQRCTAIRDGKPLSVGTIGDLEEEMRRGQLQQPAGGDPHRP